MTRPMKYGELARLLADAGFTMKPDKGDHEKWTALDGSHVTITHSREVSPGVTRQALTAIERLREGG